jgi:hypothetical protein
MANPVCVNNRQKPPERDGNTWGIRGESCPKVLDLFRPGVSSARVVPLFHDSEAESLRRVVAGSAAAAPSRRGCL